MGVISGEVNFLFPSHMNYGKVFLDQILKFDKNKPAVIDGETGEKITYGELAQLIINTAASLKRRGIKKGDVVAVCSENRIEVVITILAVFCSGAVLTLLNSAYSEAELIHTSNISKPKYVFLSPNACKQNYKTFKSLNMIKEFFIFGDETISGVQASRFEEIAKEFVDINSFQPTDFYGHAEVALILYSSGTTGLSKGAKITHANYITTSFQAQTSPRDLITLTITPFCNTMGILTLTDSLYGGKTVVFLRRFMEDTYLKTIEKYKIQFLLVAPPIIVMLCKSSILHKYDVSSIEIFSSGGAPLDPNLIKEAKNRFPNLLYVLQGYGMTETTGVLIKETESTYKVGSVGKVAAGNIIKVVDVESQSILGPCKEGEIRVKGPVLFNGYIGKPLEDDLDEDGFFKTGDIGYYDEDGYFFIVDRLKELIKFKAWQVSPAELEAILLQHPAVNDVGVAGAPDPLAGELPTAFVVKKPKTTVAEKELIDFVASKLTTKVNIPLFKKDSSTPQERHSSVSPWKQIRGGVRFVEEIPKTGSGKILRRILRATLSKAPASKL